MARPVKRIITDDTKKNERCSYLFGLIEGERERYGYTDAELCAMAHINPCTYKKRKENPASWRLDELWPLLDILDAGIIFKRRPQPF